MNLTSRSKKAICEYIYYIWHMAILRIVFEFEQDEARVTPALLEKFWPHSESDALHRAQGLESELALLAAAEAQPHVVRQLWLEKALEWLLSLEDVDTFDMMKPLISPCGVASEAGADLKPLAVELNEYARAYFLEEGGMIEGSDHELLVRWVRGLRMRQIKIEDSEGSLLNSDDVSARRSTRKDSGK